LNNGSSNNSVQNVKLFTQSFFKILVQELPLFTIFGQQIVSVHSKANCQHPDQQICINAIALEEPSDMVSIAITEQRVFGNLTCSYNPILPYVLPFLAIFKRGLLLVFSVGFGSVYDIIIIAVGAVLFI
jgi:hypothetical protein